MKIDDSSEEKLDTKSYCNIRKKKDVTKILFLQWFEKIKKKIIEFVFVLLENCGHFLKKGRKRKIECWWAQKKPPPLAPSFFPLFF